MPQSTAQQTQSWTSTLFYNAGHSPHLTGWSNLPPGDPSTVAARHDTAGVARNCELYRATSCRSTITDIKVSFQHFMQMVRCGHQPLAIERLRLKLQGPRATPYAAGPLWSCEVGSRCVHSLQGALDLDLLASVVVSSMHVRSCLSTCCCSCDVGTELPV